MTRGLESLIQLVHADGAGTIVPGVNGLWTRLKNEMMQITDEATAVSVPPYVFRVPGEG